MRSTMSVPDLRHVTTLRVNLFFTRARRTLMLRFSHEAFWQPRPYKPFSTIERVKLSNAKKSLHFN